MPPAARQNDAVTGTDVHVLLVPSPGGAVPTPTPMPFAGTITAGTSPDVLVNGLPAAVVGSTALNLPPHLPTGGTFQRPPSNRGAVLLGSASVLIDGKAAARLGDPVTTCNDPVDAPTSRITAGSPDVVIG